MKKILLFIFTTVSITIFSQTLTLENIFKDGVFRSEGVSGLQHLPSGDFYTVTTKTSIDKHNFVTGEFVTTILSNKMLNSLSNDSLTISKIYSYDFSKNEDKMLLATDVEYLYRRTSKGFYYLFDIKENRLTSVSDKTKGKISFATISDNGDKIAFVRNLNLFYIDIKTGNEVQVTFDGKENQIINGLPDWVYEEELGVEKTFSWSPDGKYLAYMRFDETHVKEFSMTIWGDLYPEEYKFKYPKAGEDNSEVEIFVFNTESHKSEKVEIKTTEEVYYPRLYWLSNSTDLMALQLNRLQNKLEFVKYNVLNHNYDVVFTDKNSCWLNVTDEYYFLPDNNAMVLTSEQNGFNHIYLVDFKGKTTQLTSGDWEVASIEFVNPKTKQIFYLSNEANRANT